MAKNTRVSNNDSGSDTSALLPANSDLSGLAPSLQGHTSQPLASFNSPAAQQAPKAPLPNEVERGDWTVLILALMIFLAPSLGVPNEMMLQDTLKSIVVSSAAVGAGLLFFWRQRHRREGLRWHLVMYLPLALMLYALGSMVWSHTYLGGVEAIRWFVFGLILWLGINTFSRQRTPYLLEGIHWGAFVASLWTVFQFYFDFTYFPQGPNPASTFVNRNFFAEFVVCTFPFTVYLLSQAKTSSRISMLTLMLGFNLIALMMTGTRGALAAMWMLLLLMPLILIRYRKQLALSQWDAGQRFLAIAFLIATVITMGLTNSGNPKVLADRSAYGDLKTPFDMAFKRTVSISTKDGSLGTRFIMWKATGEMIKARPLSGVGAGAWEVMQLLYQPGAQLETDYYAHNEILQLLAEYGLVGWIFLLLLLFYLLISAWRTLRNLTPEGLSEAPLRATALTSMLAFLTVSNIGFPWRLASTGCIFAFCLALLAASDARLSVRGVVRLSWRPAYSQVMAMVMMVCLALTAYISQQAAATESKIVSAIKMAQSITASGDVDNPKWDNTKREILTLAKDSIAINTHYRKITPMLADELAKWGDWKNAIWILESVVVSRPYVPILMSTVARWHAQIGNTDKAFEYLARCEKFQPNSPSVRSLKVILLSQNGKEPEAAVLAQDYMNDGIYDFDLLNAAFVLGMRKSDFDMAIQALTILSKEWPASKREAQLKLAGIYVNNKKNDAKALAAFKAALELTPDKHRDNLRKQIPPQFQAQL